MPSCGCQRGTRRRFLPAVEEAGPELTGCGCPLGGALGQGRFEVGVDVGGELWREGPVGEGGGAAVFDLAAAEDELDVELAGLDCGEWDV